MAENVFDGGGESLENETAGDDVERLLAETPGYWGRKYQLIGQETSADRSGNVS